jgi:hypothetical protein
VDRVFLDSGDEPEVELPRGDVTDGVVRVGATVRRPHQPQSPAVAAYLDHLAASGFDASPRYLGRDASGRDVLTYLPGDVAGDPPQRWAADEDLLASVAALVRRLNDASLGFPLRPFPDAIWHNDLVPFDPPHPMAEGEFVSHMDVTPQNVVVRDGRAVGLVDFDMAGPTTRWLTAHGVALHWAPLFAPEDVWPTWEGVDQLGRLRIVADGVGLDEPERVEFAERAVQRAETTYAFMRAAAQHRGGGWQRMWDNGVGAQILRRRDWLDASRAQITRSLCR